MRSALLREGIIEHCKGCTLSCICKWIDEMLEDYVEEATNVINSFKVD